MLRDVGKEVLVRILMSTMGVFVLGIILYLLIDYSRSDVAAAYSDASTSLSSKVTNVSKIQFRQEYEEMISGEQITSSGITTEGTGQSTNLNRYYVSGKLDTSSSKVYSLLESSPLFKNKADVLSIVYDAIMEKYDNLNLAIGVMANVYAEGRFGLVEYKFSKDHVAPWDANRWSGTSSNIYVVQNKGDIDYLKSLGSVCSVGVGMVQWSFGRRVQLCDRYLAALENSSALPFTPYNNGVLTNEFFMYVEVQYMLDELDSSNYSAIVQDCLRAESAESCADMICRRYEAPDDVETKSAVRQNAATDLANLLLGR